MKVLKRILCVFFAALVLCMPVVRTYQAHAAAVAASTIAAYAVLGTALTACGILIATSDIPVTDALAAAWDQTTTGIKNDIRNIKLAASITGGLVAHWTADKWSRFTSWVKETFHIGSHNFLPIAAASAGFAAACLAQSTLDLNSSPRVDYFLRSDISEFSYSLNSSSLLKFQYNSYGYIQAILVSGSSTLFQSTTSSLIARSMNGHYVGVSVFKPVLCAGSFYVPLACGYDNPAETYNTANAQKVSFADWYLSSGCGNALLVGKKLAMDNGVLKAGTTVIRGTWDSIASYIEACMDAGVVIGIPLSDGSYVEQPDVVNPGMDELPVSVDADFFPDVGASAADTDLPEGIGYDIPIPTTDEYTGQDVYVKDVTDALPIDLPRVGDLNPADARPRVRTDVATTAANPYMTAARTIDIPSEIADQTIVQPPPGGGGGEDEDEDDGNDLKLPALILTKFPFCIPHDFKVGIEQLLADPQPPMFKFHLKIDSIHIDKYIPVDFSSFESVAYFVRWLISAFWIIILIRGTLRIIKI